MNQDQIEAHLAFRKHELGTDPNERKWLKWAADVEAILEHDLDGDQQDDGYSIDTAFDFYEDGLTVQEAAVEFAALGSSTTTQEKMMEHIKGKHYEGRPESEEWNQVGDVVVMAGGALDSEQYKLDPRFDLANHSPTGFAWGYLGSGPAQLALAILADVTNPPAAMRHYQAFKHDKIATLGRGAWTIEAADVLEWLAAREGDASD